MLRSSTETRGRISAATAVVHVQSTLLITTLGGGASEKCPYSRSVVMPEVSLYVTYYIWTGLCSGHGNSVVIHEVSLYPQSLLAKLTVVNCSSLKLLGRCLSLFIGANMSAGIIGSHISTMHTFLYLQQENASGQVCPVKFLQIPLSGTRFKESRAYVRCSDHACQTFLYSSCNSVHNLCTVRCVHAWANSIHAHCLSFLASIQVMPLHESLFDTTVYFS